MDAEVTGSSERRGKVGSERATLAPRSRPTHERLSVAYTWSTG
ncbi:hypothetical protein [Micromonospora pisi]|nr:hypothetical protein [Micromonospora pisi]